ncbi:lysylphosphatidylglycerol synthase-like protein [Winogradskyella wandonensis]|uniref:Lysylphosphatidylglycerol synthase-like protein n=1 Tax=Winogradskyella wandonensis TaxID=1442586 RepID=A0A4R1KLK2_9FLAO|nr:lysylphosphatidylglycerol synthase domain-containing protein [Winogradskyella wandonensis]TCK65170.1 lysylphosphatidylglycerol synthase-like protein [Winogradskyella wandonensis]
MLGSLPYKTKQFFIAIIKLSIIVGASYYIYNRLLNNENLNFTEFTSLLTKNNVFSAKNIFFLLILSVFNWFFEILKWKNLVKTIKKISFFEALEQSLGGLTASLITPNRIGDYGAKAIYFAKQYRKRVILLNLIGNVNQMAVTTIIGIIGLILFYKNYDLEINFYKVSRLLVILIVLAVFTAFGLKQSRFRIKGFSIEQIINFVKQLPQRTHIKTFILSLVRYAIFSFQFYFLLQIFGTSLDYKTAMIAISSMYFLSSIVPSLAVFDVLIKTSAAVFLFSHLGIDELTILSVSTLMWLLNFVLPSIFGSYFVLNFRLPKVQD